MVLRSWIVSQCTMENVSFDGTGLGQKRDLTQDICMNRGG